MTPKHTTLAALLAILVVASGCVADMVTKRLAESDNRKAYLDYRTRTEALNLEREKAGLAPTPIMTWEEWQPTPHKTPTTQTRSPKAGS